MAPCTKAMLRAKEGLQAQLQQMRIKQNQAKLQRDRILGLCSENHPLPTNARPLPDPSRSKPPLGICAEELDIVQKTGDLRPCLPSHRENCATPRLRVTAVMPPLMDTRPLPPTPSSCRPLPPAPSTPRTQPVPITPRTPRTPQMSSMWQDAPCTDTATSSCAEVEAEPSMRPEEVTKAVEVVSSRVRGPVVPMLDLKARFRAASAGSEASPRAMMTARRLDRLNAMQESLGQQLEAASPRSRSASHGEGGWYTPRGGPLPYTPSGEMLHSSRRGVRAVMGSGGDFVGLATPRGIAPMTITAGTPRTQAKTMDRLHWLTRQVAFANMRMAFTEAMIASVNCRLALNATVTLLEGMRRWVRQGLLQNYFSCWEDAVEGSLLLESYTPGLALSPRELVLEFAAFCDQVNLIMIVQRWRAAAPQVVTARRQLQLVVRAKVVLKRWRLHQVESFMDEFAAFCGV